MKKSLIILQSFFSSLFFLFSPIFAKAQYGLEEAAGAANLNSGSLTGLIGDILNVALSMIGILFFALILYGGFLWMTARGKEDVATKAKDTITAAIIGLIIIFSAYAITNFVFENLEGTSGSPVSEPNPTGSGIGWCVSNDATSCNSNNDCDIYTNCHIETGSCVSDPENVEACFGDSECGSGETCKFII